MQQRERQRTTPWPMNSPKMRTASFSISTLSLTPPSFRSLSLLRVCLPACVRACMCVRACACVHVRASTCSVRMTLTTSARQMLQLKSLSNGERAMAEAAAAAEALLPPASADSTHPRAHVSDPPSLPPSLSLPRRIGPHRGLLKGMRERDGLVLCKALHMVSALRRCLLDSPLPAASRSGPSYRACREVCCGCMCCACVCVGGCLPSLRISVPVCTCVCLCSIEHTCAHFQLARAHARAHAHVRDQRSYTLSGGRATAEAQFVPHSFVCRSLGSRVRVLA